MYSVEGPHELRVEGFKSSFKKLRSGAMERRGLAGDTRQANVEERALLTGRFELGEWRLLGIN